jgi:hypothetical protein
MFSNDGCANTALYQEKAEVLSGLFNCWHRLYRDGECCDYDLVVRYFENVCVLA